MSLPVEVKVHNSSHNLGIEWRFEEMEGAQIIVPIGASPRLVITITQMDECADDDDQEAGE